MSTRRARETDDWKAAGMEADCPPRIDRVNSYLLDERTSFFYMLVYNSNGKCLLRSGQVSCPPEQTDTNRIRMNDEQAATSPSGHIEAQRAGGTAARVILLLSRWPP